MRQFLTNLYQTLLKIFHGKNLLWHGLLILLTAILVLTGFDWTYYEATRGIWIVSFGMVAGMLGFAVPVFVPLGMLASAWIGKDARLKMASVAMIQAGILGLGISSLYKVFTGRVGLPHVANAADASRTWLFGIYRGGAFQGWPSSHTSVAFAMSVALVMLYPEKKWLKFVALGYALFIGLGASVGFHWFSDFAAGAILGTLIGVTVGKRHPIAM